MRVLNKIWNKNNWNKGSKEYNKWFHNISSDKQKSTTNRYSEPKTLSKIVDGIINDFSILIIVGSMSLLIAQENKFINTHPMR